MEPWAAAPRGPLRTGPHRPSRARAPLPSSTQGRRPSPAPDRCLREPSPPFPRPYRDSAGDQDKQDGARRRTRGAADPQLSRKTTCLKGHEVVELLRAGRRLLLGSGRDTVELALAVGICGEKVLSGWAGGAGRVGRPGEGGTQRPGPGNRQLYFLL